MPACLAERHVSVRPGALPSSLTLAQARASGVFTTAHERFWRRARRKLGDAAGTRARIEVLLLHRRLPFVAVHAALDAVEGVGSCDPGLVAIEARRVADPRGRTTIGADRTDRTGWTRPMPALAGYDACRALRLPTVRAQHGELAEAAVRDRLSHRAFLAELLGAEVEERDARRRERRIAEARFPRSKRLEDFDLTAAPTIEPAMLASLSTLAWVTTGEPVVLLGDPGPHAAFTDAAD